jgi:hypothetical protein
MVVAPLLLASVRMLPYEKASEFFWRFLDFTGGGVRNREVGVGVFDSRRWPGSGFTISVIGCIAASRE